MRGDISWQLGRAIGSGIGLWRVELQLQAAPPEPASADRILQAINRGARHSAARGGVALGYLCRAGHVAQWIHVQPSSFQQPTTHELRYGTH